MSSLAPSRKLRRDRGTALFLRRWLRGPLRIGAVAPSGEALSRAMARAVLAIPGARTGTIVELGPGTGSFTTALLEHGIDRRRLILVERDPELCRWLQAHVAGVRVLHGDAAKLRELLAASGVERAAAVLSGLPLLSMPRATVHDIVGGAFSVLAPGGAFVQFTYGPASPIYTRVLEDLGITGRGGKRIWLNVPPAVVWTFRRDPSRQAGRKVA